MQAFQFEKEFQWKKLETISVNTEILPQIESVNEYEQFSQFPGK